MRVLGWIGIWLVACGPGSASVDAGNVLDGGADTGATIDAGAETDASSETDAGAEITDAGAETDAGTDAGTDPGPTCDVERTFPCDVFECRLDQLCDARSARASVCVDLPPRNVCTPCSTQARAVESCPRGFFRELEGSSTEGCTVRCR